MGEQDLLLNLFVRFEIGKKNFIKFVIIKDKILNQKKNTEPKKVRNF